LSIAIILAFAMTMITASSNIILKKGFFKVTPFLAVYISVFISVVFLWIATFLFVPKHSFFNYKGILVFIIIGSFAPTIVRTLTYYGIHKLGASRAAPIRALTPFFATILAIIFLGETPGPGIFLGILFIVLGVISLSRKEEKSLSQWKFIHMIYPLGAAVLAGLAANLRKFGLNLMPQPIFASAIAATTSLIVLTLFMVTKYNEKEGFIKSCRSREMLFIIIAAFLVACGEIVDLSALLYGKVSLVVPIFATTPFMIVVFSRIFLKDYEVVTKRLVLSTVLIICGVYLAIINV
jgi:DME family drug/metabolite transporter